MIGLLSVPTWIIHIGSIVEWVVAMWLFWKVGRKLNNVWLKRMPLVMLPYGISGLCAIAYHISYDQWDGFSVAQTWLTFFGSCCFALWAFMLLRSLPPRKPVRKGSVQGAKEAGRE